MVDKIIVLIDDQRDFAHPRKSPVIIARNSFQGLQVLLEQPYIDELWLDHDLGYQDDIRRVVEYLEAERDPVSVRRVYVHTMNPSGADWMMRGLHRAGYKVFRAEVKGLLRNVTQNSE